MENSWLKNPEDEDENLLDKITKKAIKKVNSFKNTPTKEILDDEDKSYIEERFIKTNDDNLQEDYAKHLIINGYDGNEKLNKLEESGGKIEDKLNKELNKKQLRLTEIYQVLVELGKLEDEIEVLEIQLRINPKFLLNKSDVPKEELNKMINAELKIIYKKIKALQFKIQTETNSKNFEECVDKYSKLRDDLDALYKAYFPEDPEIN